MVPVDLSARQQVAPDFPRISPDTKIPAIVDEDAEGGPIAVFESGAILTDLAGLADRLLPQPRRERMEVLSWLNWQMGGLGPTLGQRGVFLHADEQVPMAIRRYADEAARLLRVPGGRLSASRFVGGADHSIADIACYPWVAAAATRLARPLATVLAGIPAVRAWADALGERPAVRPGMEVP